jgi:putative phosphoesterase
MKLIAFSDIHSSYEQVIEILRKESGYEAILIAGDLTTVGSAAEAESALKQFADFGVPIFMVAGNMDPIGVQQVLEDSDVSVTGKGKMFNNIGITGIGGCPKSIMRTPNEFSEEILFQTADEGFAQLMDAQQKILISHSPPYNTEVDKVFLGRNVGSKAVREIIEKYQPDVVICGHIHESKGIDKIGKSKIVNCGPASKGNYVIINISNTINIEMRR